MKRMLLALIMLSLAGCDATPASLGLTGPAPPPPAPKVDDSTIMAPGIPDPGNGYGPSIGTPPSPGSYYNYN
jgi:hypothetical protein